MELILRAGGNEFSKLPAAEAVRRVKVEIVNSEVASGLMAAQEAGGE
jgi:hypothetical protein